MNDHKRRLRHHHEKEIFNHIYHTLEKLDESTDPLDKHHYLEYLSYWYYRYKEYPGFIEKCIEYSLKDIELYDVCMNRFELKNFDSLISEYRNVFGNNPISEIQKRRMLVHSFVSVIKRLTITYEKFSQFDLAINLCKKAIILGIIDDTTKGGFEKRIASLEKKRNKSGSSVSIQNPPASLS